MASTAGQPPAVFVSYSHRDREWLDRLRVHLKPLERNGTIGVWDDTHIAAGQAWHAEIRRALDAAAVAVLLISAELTGLDRARVKDGPLREIVSRELTAVEREQKQLREEQDADRERMRNLFSRIDPA